MMAGLPILVVALHQLLLTNALVIVPHRQLYQVKKNSFGEDISNLTRRVEALEGRVESHNDQIQNSKTTHEDQAPKMIELLTNHEKDTKSADKRLKVLEENMLQLKVWKEEIEKGPTCPSDFIFNESPKLCFKIINNAEEQVEVLGKKCSELVDGGRLLTLGKPEKLAFIQQQVKNGPSAMYAIGGEKTSSGFWKWYDGTVVARNQFCPGEPRGGSYLSLWGEKGYCLDDIKRGSRLRFICELPM